MLKAIQIPVPIEQQAALAEMELGSAANGPAGAAAMEYEVQQQPPSTTVVEQQLQQQQQQQQSQEPKSEEAGQPEEMEEFKLFRDYFGLCNLVKSLANVPDDLDSPLSDYSYEQEIRERRDSLGSAGSEFSSSNSAESIEVADIYYTAYGQDGMMAGVKQAFMADPRDDSLKANTPNSLPTSLLLEHKIITSVAAKKPQVSGYTKPVNSNCFYSKPTTVISWFLIVRLELLLPSLQVCVFCRNNGESESFYTSHYLKDAEGKVTCPVLRAYTCPLCGANGDAAHTIKYCPENSQSVKNGGVKRATITVTRKKWGML